MADLHPPARILRQSDEGSQPATTGFSGALGTNTNRSPGPAAVGKGDPVTRRETPPGGWREPPGAAWPAIQTEMQGAAAFPTTSPAPPQRDRSPISAAPCIRWSAAMNSITCSGFQSPLGRRSSLQKVDEVAWAPFLVPHSPAYDPAKATQGHKNFSFPIKMIWHPPSPSCYDNQLRHCR